MSAAFFFSATLSAPPPTLWSVANLLYELRATKKKVAFDRRSLAPSLVAAPAPAVTSIDLQQHNGTWS